MGLKRQGGDERLAPHARTGTDLALRRAEGYRIPVVMAAWRIGVAALLVVSLTAPNAAEAQRRRRRAAPETAQLQIDGTEGAEVFIDDESVGTLPMDGPVEVHTGQVRLRVQLEGHTTVERTFTAAAGDVVEEHATLLPVEEARSSDDVPTFGVMDQSAPTVRRRSNPIDGGGPPAGAVALVVTGLLVAGGGGALLGVGFWDKDTVENAQPRTMWADVSEAYDRAPTLILVGDIALAVGLTTALIGIIWWAIVPNEGGSAMLRNGPELEVRF